jgi:hypothetical protein
MISLWKNYVINDSKYSPVGGETCNDNEAFTNCTNAIKELKTLHWSYINEFYHPDVIQRWKDEGCYEEISENIGYRLVAKDLSLEQSSKNLKIALSINNKGYAAPYTLSDVKLILKDINTTNEYLFELNNTDVRTFYSQETNLIQSSISLNEVNKGEYCLYIKLSKNYANIKLSNLNMWNDEVAANLLKCEIVIN